MYIYKRVGMYMCKYVCIEKVYKCNLSPLFNLNLMPVISNLFLETKSRFEKYYSCQFFPLISIV